MLRILIQLFQLSGLSKQHTVSSHNFDLQHFNSRVSNPRTIAHLNLDAPLESSDLSGPGPISFRLNVRNMAVRPISLLTLWVSEGFHSSIMILLMGGILMSMGDFPESLSQAMPVWTILAGRLGVLMHVLRVEVRCYLFV